MRLVRRPTRTAAQAFDLSTGRLAGCPLVPVVRKGLCSWLLGLAACVSGGLALVAEASGADWTPTASRAEAYFEEDDAAVSWSGSWSTNPLAVNSGGGARLAMDAGARASFVFTGTGVSWIGYRDEWCGIAAVSLDGVLRATVDTYASPATAQAALYAITGLGRETHTLTIEATGTHNAASRGSWVWVDAFSVTQAWGGGRAPTASLSHPHPPAARRDARASRAARASRTQGPEDGTRLDQDDPAVTWSGTWSTNQLAIHGGGSARLSMETSARVSVVFTGTGVSWIGYRDEWSGIADVLLDGRLRATVDTYAKPARAQAELYAIDGLPEGDHTLTIQPTGRRRQASGGSWIWVDAFSIRR